GLGFVESLRRACERAFELGLDLAHLAATEELGPLAPVGRVVLFAKQELVAVLGLNALSLFENRGLRLALRFEHRELVLCLRELLASSLVLLDLALAVLEEGCRRFEAPFAPAVAAFGGRG